MGKYTWTTSRLIHALLHGVPPPPHRWRRARGGGDGGLRRVTYAYCQFSKQIKVFTSYTVRQDSFLQFIRKQKLIKHQIEANILLSSRWSKSWHDTWTNLKQFSRYLNSCVFRYPQIHQHLQEFLVRTFPLWYSSTTRCRLLGRLCRATNRLGKVLLRVIHLENRTLKESGTERFFGAPKMHVITVAVSHARRAECPQSPRKRSLRDQCGYFLYSAFIFLPSFIPSTPPPSFS